MALVAIVDFEGDEFKANCARAMLESEGIQCFLLNEFATGLQPHYGLARGIQLQVLEHDVEAAYRLLAAHMGLGQPQPQLGADGKPRSCPKCGGGDVRYRKWYILFSLVFFLPFGGSPYLCGQCGHTWK